MHHPQLTSPTEWRIYNLRPRKTRKYSIVGKYSHAQMVKYVMTQYFLIKVIKDFTKVGEASV